MRNSHLVDTEDWGRDSVWQLTDFLMIVMLGMPK